MTKESPVPAATDPALAAQIEALKAAGEHAAAASALWAAGQLQKAGELFEEIFEFPRALRAFEMAEDFVSALRVALRSHDDLAIERIITRATRAGQADALIRALQVAGRFQEIGRIYLASGELAAAAQAFEQGEEFFQAGLAREGLGDLRGAGVLYEQHLEQDPEAPEACLRLGKILCRFSRYDDGIALLQTAIIGAVEQAETICAAAPAIIRSFLKLEYEEAAAAALEQWQGAAAQLEAQSAPLGMEAFLASDMGGQPQAEASFRGDDASLVQGSDDVDKDQHLAGRYLLGEPLGGGGVGQVFRAFDAFTDQPVAVKIFGNQAMTSSALELYAREVRASATLRHPAIIPVVELNMPQGFLVTAFVDRPTVEKRLQSGGEAGWLLPMVRALLDLLGVCHRVGLVHGALKPTNLFAMPGGIRVADFGAHQLLALRSTETGGLASVWPYLAPEQLFGAPADVAADLYAVAAILYRALCGVPPFGQADADRHQPPPLLSTRREDLGPQWDVFFSKALHPDATERFDDAAALGEALPLFPEDLMLPQARFVGVKEEGNRQQPAEASGRYLSGSLVWRGDEGVKVFEGQDLILQRAIWLVDAPSVELLAPLLACAKLGRGAQPIYDALPEAGRVVLARDESGAVADLEVALRKHPLGLLRDLRAVAFALKWLHQAGYCLGGFPAERVLGPIGPRLRFAPAPLPRELTPRGQRADEESFVAFLNGVFGVPDANDVDPQLVFLERLRETQLLTTYDANELTSGLGQNPTWGALLDAISSRLVFSSSGRVIAHLAANILNTSDSDPNKKNAAP